MISALNFVSGRLRVGIAHGFRAASHTIFSLLEYFPQVRHREVRKDWLRDRIGCATRSLPVTGARM